MNTLAHALVELTGSRDRTVLQRNLTGALVELYAPCRARQLCLAENHWRTVWTAGARMRPHRDPTIQTARHEALARGQTLHLGQAPWLSVFPLGRSEVLELERAGPASPDVVLAGNQLLRVQQNMLRLLDYGERDSLTGLLNRKTFDEVFRRLTRRPDEPLIYAHDEAGRRHPRLGAPFWLALIDIDHFKVVNDAHGHLAGDQVLVMVAQLMSESFRQQDRLYRFGGEEFVVLLNCTDHQGVFTSLERLRRRIERHRFPGVGHLSISAGFTRIRSDDSPMGAFARADRAVYAAKEAGRNQVLAHEGEGTAPAPTSLADVA